MKRFLRFLRLSSISIFFAGIISTITSCTDSDQIAAILLILVLFLTGGGADSSSEAGEGSNPTRMYWVDSVPERISRASINGTERENLLCGAVCPEGQVDTDLISLRGLAVSISNGKIYWTDITSDRIKRANLDGTGSENLICSVVCTGGKVDADIDTPTGIALDITNGKIYWTDTTTKRIKRANLDGTGSENLICSAVCAGGQVDTDIDEPIGIALDVTNGKMYWTDISTKRIKRANLDGTGSENLICSVVCAGGQVDTDISIPNGLALDDINDKMYWIDNITQRIKRANLDGTASENLICRFACLGGQVDADIINLQGIALDVSSGKMYWTDTTSDRIKRANLDGTASENLLCDDPVGCPGGIFDAGFTSARGFALGI